MAKPLSDLVDEAIADIRQDASPELILSVLRAIQNAQAMGKCGPLTANERIAAHVLGIFNYGAPLEAMLDARRLARATV